MSRVSIAFGILAGIVIACLPFLAAGCGNSPTAQKEDPSQQTKKADPWEATAERLRRERDLSACKSALGQLNNELSERTDVAGAPGLTNEAEAALKSFVPLSSDDILELRPAAFTSLDPAYLAECFYLRDAAQSLDASGLPAIEQARLGFAWVCRQLYLMPWEHERDGFIPAVPTTYALRRGSGSGLERAYVFLALLQQMGLDACLIGGAGAAEKFTAVFDEEKRKIALRRGPFWAVGIRNGSDIALFDPWRGERVPGTLAEVKADPNRLKAWFEDKARPWDVTPDEVRNATVCLAVPLSSQAPRLAVLEKRLQAETGVRLSIDAAGLKSRFAASAPHGPAVEAKFWNPPRDRFTYTRVLITFLPTEEGGLDRADAAHQLHGMYQSSLVPKSLIDVPKSLKPAAAERILTNIFALYEASFLTAPGPRDRIQRGQFQDAARDLTTKLERFTLGLERLRRLDPAEIEPWCEQANSAFDNLNQKRFPNPAQLAPQPDSDPEVAEAKAALETFWRSNEVSRSLVDRATASLGRGEALYLLALSKHEEAERRQSRGANAASRDTWLEASNAWESFLISNGASASDPRTLHARKLAARARQFAEQK